jgi:hypothetical protein
MVKYIFIIPYRNRPEHKHFFDIYITHLLEDMLDYEIIFAHQANDLPFNRGGMKNCGFLYAKNKYPNTYKNIIFIFNDIDTLPYKKNLLNYDLKKNEIKHYYGFKFCLGGIFAIYGEDFEKINGFPNLWSWGYEDTIIYERAINKGININREQYYEYGDSNILHFIDGVIKRPSIRNRNEYVKKNINDGISNLKNIRYEFNSETNMLDIYYLECSYSPIDNTEVNLYINLNNQQNKPNQPNPKRFISMKFI